MSRCTCGHDQTDHIYHSGACRPGFVCPQACLNFTASPADEEQSTLPSVSLADLSVAARVGTMVYYFAPDDRPPGATFRVENGLHRDVLRAMLQHALDQLDDDHEVERTLDGRPV